MAVLRRLFPYVIEATLIPTILYYAGMLTFGAVWGVLAGAAWTYLSVARRRAKGQPIPTLLVLAVLGFTVRVLMYVLNGNAFVYFMQPIARTVLTAMVLVISVGLRRPLVARFAADFCNFGPDVANRPAIVSLFRRLTYLWAGALATVAAVNLTLLLTVPLAVFVGTATAVGWVGMSAGAVLTVADAVRTTRRDGLRTAVAAGGRLHAYVATV